MEKEMPKRKPTRLKDFDYNSAGEYFVTICTENRQEILSRIVGDVAPYWIKDTKGTALCPYCGIDSVIGTYSGFPITTEFLSEMKEYWF